MHQTENQLIVIESKDAYQVFTTEGALDPIIARVKQEIDKFEPEVSTERGRKEIASMAYKVARSKTYLDNVGKQIADEVKKTPKVVDANRRHARETLAGRSSPTAHAGVKPKRRPAARPMKSTARSFSVRPSPRSRPTGSSSRTPKGSSISFTTARSRTSRSPIEGGRHACRNHRMRAEFGGMV